MEAFGMEGGVGHAFKYFSYQTILFFNASRERSSQSIFSNLHVIIFSKFSTDHKNENTDNGPNFLNSPANKIVQRTKNK